MARNPLTRVVPFLMLFFGLHFSAYPEVSPEWSPWSRQLFRIGQFIFPAGSEYWRFWPGIGAQFMATAVLLSPCLQRILSHRILIWLGSLSFPLYLIHGPLIRSLLTWMTFGYQDPIFYYTQNPDGSLLNSWFRYPFPDDATLYIATPIFFCLLLLAAHIWTLTIEPRCAWITKRAEDIMYGEISLGGEKEGRLKAVGPLSLV